jgi:hypothetical protein
VNGDERYFHCFDPETKRQSMEWHHPAYLREEVSQIHTLGWKSMGTVFCDADVCVLVDFLQKNVIVNAVPYVRMYQTL